VATAIYLPTFFRRNGIRLLSALSVAPAARPLGGNEWSGHKAIRGILVALQWLGPAAAVAAGINNASLGTATEFPVNVEFSIGDLEFFPSFQFNGISARCSKLSLTENRVECANATLVVKDSPFGQITLAARIGWHPGSGRWIVDAKGDFDTATKLVLHLVQGDGGTHVRLDLEAFELALAPEVIGILPPVLAEHVVETGTLTVNAECRVERTGALACNVHGDIQDLNLNGVNVAENVTMDFDATYSNNDAEVEIEFGMSITEGAVYIEPGFTLGSINPGFFLAVADAPIDLATRIVRSASGEIRVLAVDLSHPDVVDMHFDGDLVVVPSLHWKHLDFALRASDVKQFYLTYMQPIALDTAFNSLETAGGVSVKVSGTNDEIDGLNIRFDEVYVDDEAGRFSVYGLDGEIELHAGDESRSSHIGWIGGALYRIEIGPGRIDWVSAARNLEISGWQDVAIFDGEFHMDTLEIENVSTANTKISLSGTVSPITLSALTAAFGWMPLSGKLSGSIPRLTYSAGHLDMEGALEVNVFDGSIVIRDLKIDEMFSTLPLLSANINIGELALEELTRTFSFGNIAGRLSGEIKDLELQAWRPIAFDASFATPIDDDSPHRISQQAVDNLGLLGAGTGTALSQGWLGLIPSYSYGRLGIACRLINGYCLMSGVEDAPGGGFFILTRGGILPPWIDVKGSGRRIKWQTLVDGIKKISQGNWELNVGS